MLTDKMWNVLSFLSQSFFLAAAPITEHNCPDQTGRVSLNHENHMHKPYKLPTHLTNTPLHPPRSSSSPAATPA